MVGPGISIGIGMQQLLLRFASASLLLPLEIAPLVQTQILAKVLAVTKNCCTIVV